MKTRACGKVHPQGMPCLKPVLYEDGCCADKVYDHDGPHEHTDEDGVITKRWEEQLQVVDLPYNAYGPWVDNEEQPATAERAT